MLCKNHPTQLCQNVYSEGWNMLVWRMRHICTGLQAFQVLDVTTDLNFVKVFQSHASCPGKMSRLIWSQWFTKHEKCCIHKGISSLKKNWWRGGAQKKHGSLKKPQHLHLFFFPTVHKTCERHGNVLWTLFSPSRAKHGTWITCLPAYQHIIWTNLLICSIWYNSFTQIKVSAISTDLVAHYIRTKDFDLKL